MLGSPGVRTLIRIAALLAAQSGIAGFTLGTAEFGVISSARPARTIQVGTRLTF